MVLRLLKSSPPSASERGSGSAGPTDPLRGVVAKAGEGDAEAERTVLMALGPPVLKVVRAVLGAHHPEVEDVFQESMVAVHHALPGFRGECTTTHFACRVALLTSMNARRRHGYRSRHTPSTAPEALEAQGDDRVAPDRLLEATRRRDALRDLLLELPGPQAEVLGLHTMLGHTVQEVAAAIGCPVDTVRSRLRAALATLRARVRADQTLIEALRGPA